jgi:hypothetical protein
MSPTEYQYVPAKNKDNKVLFLDIDGVLNSEEFYKNEFKSGNKTSRFDSASVLIAKKIIEEYSLEIVISSTWRFGAIDMLMHELQKNKLIKYLHNDWFTPVIHPAHRGTEIKYWLDIHPEVTDYIIIDDDDNILEEQKNNFVKTCIQRGLKTEHYNRVRAIFSKEMIVQD